LPIDAEIRRLASSTGRAARLKEGMDEWAARYDARQWIANAVECATMAATCRDERRKNREAGLRELAIIERHVRKLADIESYDADAAARAVRAMLLRLTPMPPIKGNEWRLNFALVMATLWQALTGRAPSSSSTGAFLRFVKAAYESIDETELKWDSAVRTVINLVRTSGLPSLRPLQ
jgi:hypothetical protein